MKAMKNVFIATVVFFLISCGGIDGRTEEVCQEVSESVGIWQRIAEPPLPVTTIEIVLQSGEEEGCGTFYIYDYESGKELLVFDVSSGLPALSSDSVNPDFQQKIEVQDNVLIFTVFDPNGQIEGREFFKKIF